MAKWFIALSALESEVSMRIRIVHEAEYDLDEGCNVLIDANKEISGIVFPTANHPDGETFKSSTFQLIICARNQGNYDLPGLFKHKSIISIV